MIKIIDWTHKDLNIIDIRKVNKLYVIVIDAIELPSTPLFVSDKIFEERLKSYFLKDGNKVTREEIMNVKWNMFITQNYYVKIDNQGNLTKFEHGENKWYVSYLEICGPLGEFASIYKGNTVDC